MDCLLAVLRICCKSLPTPDAVHQADPPTVGMAASCGSDAGCSPGSGRSSAQADFAQQPPHPTPNALLCEMRASVRQHDRLEPLSADRYKVQFTADQELKDKLDRARDLLRHANPSGDLGVIVNRALDLLDRPPQKAP